MENIKLKRLARLVQLEELGAGWFEPQTLPVAQYAVGQVEQLMELLSAHKHPLPSIYPIPADEGEGSGLICEWDITTADGSKCFSVSVDFRYNLQLTSWEWYCHSFNILSQDSLGDSESDCVDEEGCGDPESVLDWMGQWFKQAARPVLEVM